MLHYTHIVLPLLLIASTALLSHAVTIKLLAVRDQDMRRRWLAFNKPPFVQPDSGAVILAKAAVT